MAGVYKIAVDVNGTSSGSERLANQQGKSVDNTVAAKTPKKPEKTTALSKFEEMVGKERFKQLRNVTGGVTAVGYVGLDIYEQNAGFKGDSNTVAHINETKKWVGRGLATVGLLATGNYLGAALFVGYTAFELAKENREIINTRSIDQYKSAYYQQRLIYDVSGRSR